VIWVRLQLRPAVTGSEIAARKPAASRRSDQTFTFSEINSGNRSIRTDEFFGTPDSSGTRSV
jgi:hypothetical protein